MIPQVPDFRDPGASGHRLPVPRPAPPTTPPVGKRPFDIS